MTPLSRGVVAWAVLVAAVLLLPWLLGGCAVGHITPRGEVYGAALGRARLEYCEAPEPRQDCDTVARKPVCREITGGSLSVGAAEAIGSALSALAAWWAAP